MKRFAKAFACACLAVCCAFMLVACGGGSVEGTYTLYSVSGDVMGTGTVITLTVDEYNTIKAKDEAGEEELTADEQVKLMFGANMFGDESAMILEKDGVLKQSMGGEVSDEFVGSYTVDGENISMTMHDETVTGTIKDGAITIVIDEANMTMVYKK